MKMTKPKLYAVIKHYSAYQPVLWKGPGGGPLEDVVDMIYVRATSRSRAKALALKAFRHEKDGLVKRLNGLEWLSTSDNPFIDMEVDRLDNAPLLKWCDNCGGCPSVSQELCDGCNGKSVFEDDGGYIPHVAPRIAGPVKERLYDVS